MSELKTKVSEASVEGFIQAIQDEQRRSDCRAVLEMMRQATGAEPKMWGDSIVGFGSYRYKYASGREGDWFLAGFSPRKANLTLYLMGGFDGHAALVERLGKHSAGKGCIYVKRLSDLDTAVLRELIESSVKRNARASAAAG
jgi:hypothetical protein